MIFKEVKIKLMGTIFTLGIISKTDAEAKYYLSKGITEIQRIEALFSEYQSLSVTSTINNALPNENVNLNNEAFQLIKRSLDISKMTDGCFDITVGKLKKLYTFNNNEAKLPSKHTITSALKAVGYRNLNLNDTNLSLKKLVSNMHISFNAIAKGYAADAVKKLWKASNIQAGFINASGDLCVFGQKIDGSLWNVAIANPNDITKALLYIPLSNQAIATSGDSEQYFMHGEQKYAHNINPFTGKPLNRLKSVSIISPSAELSDALATAVYVMGKERGLSFINQLPYTFAIIIDNNNNISMSKKLRYEALSA